MGGRTNPPFVVVGHVNRPHGTKGEFFVWSLTDRPDDTFVEGAELRVAVAKGDVPDELFPRLQITTVRPYRKGFLLAFQGIDGRERGDLLREKYLLRPFEDVPPLDEGEVFYHQLLGTRVVTRDGREVGVIREVYPLRPVDLLEVVGKDGVRLLPFTESLVVEMDAEAGQMVIDPEEGLLEL